MLAQATKITGRLSQLKKREPQNRDEVICSQMGDKPGPLTISAYATRNTLMSPGCLSFYCAESHIAIFEDLLDSSLPFFSPQKVSQKKNIELFALTII